MAGGVIPEVGESDDEFPETGSSFLLWGERTSLLAFRGWTDSVQRLAVFLYSCSLEQHISV